MRVEELRGGCRGAVKVGAGQFRRQLTDLLNRVGYGGEEIIVERNGRPIAVLVPYISYQRAFGASQSDIEQVPALAAQLEAAREAAGIPYEELARQLQEERLRTLREKYPDFAAEFDHDKATEPAQGVCRRRCSVSCVDSLAPALSGISSTSHGGVYSAGRDFCYVHGRGSDCDNKAYLSGRVPVLPQLIARSIRAVDDPPTPTLKVYQAQAQWKDVINLAAALESQPHILVTYNVRDYHPQQGIIRIMTPGELVSTSREAIYREVGTGAGQGAFILVRGRARRTEETNTGGIGGQRADVRESAGHRSGWDGVVTQVGQDGQESV